MGRTIIPEFLYLCTSLAEVAEGKDALGDYRLEVDTREVCPELAAGRKRFARTLRLGAFEYMRLREKHETEKERFEWLNKDWCELRSYIKKFFGINNAPEEYSFTDEETERIREFILAIVEEHNSETTRKE